MLGHGVRNLLCVAQMLRVKMATARATEPVSQPGGIRVASQPSGSEWGPSSEAIVHASLSGGALFPFPVHTQVYTL